MARCPLSSPPPPPAPELIKHFADAINAQVFETNAKHGTNVDLAMLALVREVLHHREFSSSTGSLSSSEQEQLARYGGPTIFFTTEDGGGGGGGA